ncbi:MAG: hypothetical protein QW292_14625, partial [Candidatus Parvarchaeota archaeon]
LDLNPKYPDFSTIWNRIHSSMPEISFPQFNETEIATDGSGLKTSNAGEYRILKYGDNNARKKHLVIITADVKYKKLLCKTVRIEGKEHTEASIAMEQTSHILQKRYQDKEVLRRWSFRSIIHVQQAPLHWR